MLAFSAAGTSIAATHIRMSLRGLEVFAREHESESGFCSFDRNRGVGRDGSRIDRSCAESNCNDRGKL